MSDSRQRECVRCGLTGTTVMLPTGPICYRCRRGIAYHPAVCPECFELRPIAYPSTSSHGTLVCAGCAGEDSVFACTGCGREDHPYGSTRCARCILTERLGESLTDPGTGLVRAELRLLYDELAAAPRPQSVITWLKKPPATGGRLLALMARGELPITHETFRSLPAGRSHNYLRELLVGTGVLPPYHAPIDRFERWLAGILEPLDADSAAVISRYGHWHHLRRLRGLAEQGQLSKPAIYGARSNVSGAIRLSAWATRRGVTLESLTQRQLEDYLAEHPGGRNSQQNFVAWLRRSRINSTVNIPWRESTIPEVVVSDADRWDQINLLLHDEQISLYARIGGLFTLLFAQPLEKIVAMRTNQINVEDDGRVLVAFDTIPIEMGSWRKPLRLNSRPDGCCRVYRCHGVGMGDKGGRGAVRTRWILTGGDDVASIPVDPSVAGRLQKGAKAVRSLGALRGFGEMNTDARIKHLDSSYYTKWLCFASAAPEVEGASAAPILDDQIIKWLGHEAGIWFRSGSTKAYSAYLELLRSWGDQYDRTPVQVETDVQAPFPISSAA